MKKAMIALGLVVVMLFGVSSVYAIDPGVSPGHGWMHGQKTWDQWKGLNLPPEQKAKFQELHRKFIVAEPSKVNVATRILSK